MNQVGRSEADLAVEAWFRRNGLPHLISGYDPREDTLTRLRPALAVIFVIGLAITLRPDWPVSIADREVVISAAAVRVATVLGAFAGLYFTVVAIGDAQNRKEFVEDEIERLSRVMAAWAFYRGHLDREQAEAS